MSDRTAQLVKRMLRVAGLDVRRAGHPSNLGWDAMRDIAGHCHRDGGGTRPTLFDVGANAGQTVARFRDAFANPVIHCFEPGERAYAYLQKHTSDIPNLTLNNVALGARQEDRVLLQMEDSRADMNSFLKPGPDSGVAVLSRSTVPVTTIDNYCKEHHIDRIDVLKSDTQGFDLEVLRGAECMFAQGRVRLVYIELNFCRMYEGLPPVDEIMRFMRERDFDLVSFYAMSYVRGIAGWNDALFAARQPPTF